MLAMSLLSQGNQIYRSEGLLPLTRRALAFETGHLFKYESYYLYVNDYQAFQRLSPAEFMPRVDGVTYKVVKTKREADELEMQGFRIRRYIADASKRLENGAIAFCTFIGCELATTTWLCTSHQAQKSLKEPPVKVDFSKNEAWVGGSWTNPSYRRKGLHTYNSFRMTEYLIQTGVVSRDRYAIARKNVVSLAADAKFGNMRYAEGYLLRVLWWRLWWEKPISDK